MSEISLINEISFVSQTVGLSRIRYILNLLKSICTLFNMILISINSVDGVLSIE